MGLRVFNARWEDGAPSGYTTVRWGRSYSGTRFIRLSADATRRTVSEWTAENGNFRTEPSGDPLQDRIKPQTVPEAAAPAEKKEGSQSNRLPPLLQGIPFLSYPFSKTLSIGHHFVKLDWSRFNPTKATTR